MACCCKDEGKMLGLAHIGVMVTDMDKSIDFYQNVVGLELMNVENMGQTRLAFLKVGSCILELVDVAGAQARPAGVVDHIAIETKNTKAVAQALKAKGVQFETEEVSVNEALMGGVANIFFKGPDGERIELFEYLNR